MDRCRLEGGRKYIFSGPYWPRGQRKQFTPKSIPYEVPRNAGGLMEADPQIKTLDMTLFGLIPHQ